MTESYVPFGDEWEKELMKWTKPELIKKLKESLLKIKRLEGKELE